MRGRPSTGGDRAERAGRGPTPSRRTVAALACAGLLLAGCSGADEPSTPEEATTTSTQHEPDRAAPTSAPATDDLVSTSEPQPVDAPSAATTGLTPGFDLGQVDGELREHAQWVLEHLTAQATGPGAEEVTERFSAEFLEAVPADQIEPVFSQVREGPALTLTVVGPVQDRGDGAQGIELTLSGEQPLRLSLGVGADGLIDALLIQPGPPQDLPELGSWEELDQELAELGATTAVYVGDVSDGSCTPVHAPAAHEPAPSGSVFKLIVLSAVVDAVEAGALAWEDELTITAEAKSLPSGELQDRSDGARLPVQEAAGLMISISDNTATDLLMEAVGPERLAAAVDRISDEPERLTPLLSTQQFFLLGWDAPEVREQWADADPAERAALLEDVPQDLSQLRGNPFSVSDPAWPDGVGWFLTGEEICAAHAVLQEQAQSEAGEPVREILSANPGLPRPEGATYQGFKGGSAPGVLAYTFYLETAADDGSQGADADSQSEVSGRVLSVQISHTDVILATSFTDLTQAALALLVQE